MPTTKSLEEIRSLLQGPVMSIPTPFLKDGVVDFEGLANLIEIGISGGTQVTLLTAGDSQFFFMTETEIAQITRFVIERAASRTLVVAATGRWHTAKTVEFAEFSRNSGADVLMLLPPTPELDPEGLAPLYTTVAQIIPVMLVGFPPWALLDKLLEEPSICCFKEDGLDAYAFDTVQQYGDRFKMMTGGLLSRFMAQWTFGYTSFMDWSTSFAPEIGTRFWAALESGDVPAALNIIRTVETPLFSIAGAKNTGSTENYPGGWQSLWRTLLELNGVASRYLRSPQRSASQNDIDRVKPMLEQLGLIGATTAGSPVTSPSEDPIHPTLR